MTMGTTLVPLVPSDPGHLASVPYMSEMKGVREFCSSQSHRGVLDSTHHVRVYHRSNAISKFLGTQSLKKSEFDGLVDLSGPEIHVSIHSTAQLKSVLLPRYITIDACSASHLQHHPSSLRHPSI